MSISRGRVSFSLLVGVSISALAMPGAALAQAEAAPDATGAVPQDTPGNPTTEPANEEAIVVTGIRGSLRQSMDIKRNAIGVVDAISAEEMGKFPDTNLAESLQRITGVSIDRQNGEGSKVTVRGFGPDFNLVLLNGRQMPASSFPADCCTPPASRSFDFANLAAEGIAAVEVYKSGRASLPTGGIGATINILTPRPLDRPGMRGSVSVKAVRDYTFDGTKITPEISGIISQTFADNRVGILVTGSYQRRKASASQFSAGWREGYLGFENNWGSLALPGDPRYDNIENRPGENDVYQVPQNAAYDFINIDRKRLNGQAVLQVRPVDSLTATVDYTYSRNTIDSQTNSIGVWFNHNNTASSWTDGPVAGVNFYSETFRAPGTNGPDDLGELKDLAITGAVAANRTTNHSIGGNLAWDGPGGLRVVLDAHHSTAETKPTSPYGSNIAVGTSIFGVQSQTVDFTGDMPGIGVTMYPGSEIDAANIRPSGNAFRNSYMKDRINEVSLRAGYDFDASFIDSIDFGATLTENKVRSAYGFLQNDSWGGTLSAADTPDDLFDMVSLPPDLRGMGVPSGIIPSYFEIDTVGLINLLENEIGICSDAASGEAIEGCLAQFSVDRRIKERTFAPFIQSLHTFDLFDNPAHLRLGLRYEKTKVSSTALVPVPVQTFWSGGNEIAIITDPSQQTFTTLKGDYKHWLPAIDFDVSPIRDVRLRASYSHSITRAAYDQLQGGLTINSPARPDGGGTGGSGNPGLLPYKSKNIDLSAEWYYGPASYVSVGFFHKKVSNFIGTTTTQVPAFGLTNPAQGAAYQEAVAALGANASFDDILDYVEANNPELVTTSGTLRGLLGTAGDPELIFTIGQPGNSDRVAKLRGFEFAVQHNFWDTGFGAILNYTKVKSDQNYNNALRYTVTQFAITGVSDSANAVLFYDKNGIQARLAYNWRDGFLSGYGLDPSYVEEYGQLDASASWEFRKGFTVFAEGINITNSDRRGHMRSNRSVQFAQPGHARYALGVRVGF